MLHVGGGYVLGAITKMSGGIVYFEWHLGRLLCVEDSKARDIT